MVTERRLEPMPSPCRQENLKPTFSQALTLLQEVLLRSNTGREKRRVFICPTSWRSRQKASVPPSGRHKVLHDLALHVEEGRIYGFLGRNGAGKSTTIRLILRLLRPSVGRIRILGRDLQADRRSSCLRRVGSLVEAPGFYDHLSGYDNLRVAQILRGLPEGSVREGLT